MADAPKVKDRYLACKGKLYQLLSNDLFHFWGEVPDCVVAVNDTAGFSWRGGLIPFEIWQQIVAFMRWSQKEFTAEAHCTLFYNTESGEWAAWPFPQEPCGMTVKLLETDPMYAEDRKQFGKGWIMAGSVHHHCTAGAFQSGTDSADEMDKEGIHITIGKILDSCVDLHSRKVLNGSMLECDMGEFFEGPVWFQNLPKWAKKKVTDKEVFGEITNTEFPEEWKLRVKKKVYNYPGSNGNGYYGGHDSFQGWDNSDFRMSPRERSPTLAGRSVHGTPTNSGNNGNTPKALEIELKAAFVGSTVQDDLEKFIISICDAHKLTITALNALMGLDPKEIKQKDIRADAYRTQAQFKCLKIGDVRISETYIRKVIHDMATRSDAPTSI